MVAVPKIEYGVSSRPFPGETVSGDLGLVREQDGNLLICIADGLGHGAPAHVVSKQIRQFLESNTISNPSTAIEQLHETLRGSVGAAVGIGILNPNTKQLLFAGVGNISARRLGANSARLCPADGILGSQIRDVSEQCLEIGADDLLVFYTDGVSDRFEIEDIPANGVQRVRFIAKAIVDNYGKEHDDATCIVMRLEQ